MHQSTIDRISVNAYLIKRIHPRLDEFREILPLLADGYATALSILNFSPELSDQDVARALDLNWQTVKQIRRALSV